jgi:CHAT domain-containing protein
MLELSRHEMLDKRQITDDLRAARAELHSVTEAYLAHPNEFSSAVTSMADIQKAIPAGGALVTIITTKRGSVAIVLPAGAQTISGENILLIDSFTLPMLGIILNGGGDKPGWITVYKNRPNSPKQWKDFLRLLGEELWTLLLSPIHDKLRQAFGIRDGGAVVLVVHGGLGLLPLHAASRMQDGRRRYFLDDFSVSFAATVSSLVKSAATLERESKSRAALIVSDPLGDLELGRVAGEIIARHFRGEDCDKLSGQEADPTAVLGRIASKTYLHFSCHGHHSWRHAFDNALILAAEDLPSLESISNIIRWRSSEVFDEIMSVTDEFIESTSETSVADELIESTSKTPVTTGVALTLGDIYAKSDLRETRLVFLCGCETGLQDINQSLNEATDFAAAFQQAGASTVISTLWPISELAGLFIVVEFYRLHLEDAAPSEALRLAQQWLRSASAETLAGLLDRWADSLRDEQLARRLRETSIDFVVMSDQPRPFSHPDDWAAFKCTGP